MNFATASLPPPSLSVMHFYPPCQLFDCFLPLLQALRVRVFFSTTSLAESCSLSSAVCSPFLTGDQHQSDW
ncbi:hypothetical protein Bca4012_098163 [Brassica carinata]